MRPGSIWCELADATVMTLTEGEKPTWSADGLTLAFVVASDDAVEIYTTDLESMNPTPLVQGDDPVWSADDVLAFSLDDEEGTIVYTMEPGSNPVEITDGEKPSWSPDGQRLALVREE